MVDDEPMMPYFQKALDHLLRLLHERSSEPRYGLAFQGLEPLIRCAWSRLNADSSHFTYIRYLSQLNSLSGRYSGPLHNHVIRSLGGLRHLSGITRLEGLLR